MATYDTDSLEAPEAPADVGEYSRHHEWQHCPRCRGETFGRRACPLCGLDLNDATLAAAEAGVQRARTRQRLGLAAIGLVLLTALSFGALGFKLGARSVVVGAFADSVMSEAGMRHYFQRLPPQTRFQLHATQLQVIFDVHRVGAIAAIDFKPVPIPQQPATAGVPDLTITFKSDSGWLALAPDERQLVVATFAKKHQAFLAFSGLRDTTDFAVIVRSREGTPPDRVLAMRNRKGELLVSR